MDGAEDTDPHSHCSNFPSMSPLSMTSYPMQGHGGLEPFQADIGREAGHVLGKSPVHHRTSSRFFKVKSRTKVNEEDREEATIPGVIECQVKKNCYIF